MQELVWLERGPRLLVAQLFAPGLGNFENVEKVDSRGAEVVLPEHAADVRFDLREFFQIVVVHAGTISERVR